MLPKSSTGVDALGIRGLAPSARQHEEGEVQEPVVRSRPGASSRPVVPAQSSRASRPGAVVSAQSGGTKIPRAQFPPESKRRAPGPGRMLTQAAALTWRRH